MISIEGNKKSGVYSITNTATEKVYVGSTVVCMRGRAMKHRSLLRSGKHENRFLQLDWAMHGETAFRFDVIEFCEPGVCIEREQHWIDFLDSTVDGVGYNMGLAIPNAMFGRKHTPESLAKMRGRKASPETLAKMRALKGTASPEIRAKMRAACLRRSPEFYAKLSELAARVNRGKKHGPMSEEQKAKLRGRKRSPETVARMRGPKSEEHKAKLSVSCLGRPSPRKGVKLTQETKDKISSSKTGRSVGKGIPKSAEHKAKISAFRTGRSVGKGIPKSAEHRAKISASKTGLSVGKGIPKSAEHKAKISDSAIRRYAKLNLAWVESC